MRFQKLLSADREQQRDRV